MRREVRGARHGVWAFWITCELRNPHRSRSMFQVPSAWKNPQKNSRRDSERGCSGRHIAQHHAHSSNLCAACNANATQNLGVRAEVDAILNYWRGSIRLEGADGHTLAKSAVTANDCTRVNKDISEVMYAQSRSDLCFQR